MPKPRINPDKPQRKVSHSRREGTKFFDLSLRESDMRRLDTYRGAQPLNGKDPGNMSRPAAVSFLLDMAERRDSIPWEAIRNALLESFGFIERERIDGALYKAGMPKE